MRERFVIISSGARTEQIVWMEERFEAHLAPHGQVETFRLGFVDSLLTAYWNAARLIDDPRAILLFSHQDAAPAFEPGKGPGDAELLAFHSHAPWVIPALRSPDLWINPFLHLLQQPDTGFLGVAGAETYHAGSAWWNERDVRGAVLHSGSEGIRLNSYGPWGRVAVLDGLFLAARCGLFAELGEPQSRSGFHFYDMELSMRAHLAGKKNWTLPLILLHASGGKEHRDSEWRAAAERFSRHYSDHLPMKIEPQLLPGWE